jgi:hypothetical protein
MHADWILALISNPCRMSGKRGEGTFCKSFEMAYYYQSGAMPPRTCFLSEIPGSSGRKSVQMPITGSLSERPRLP